MLDRMPLRTSASYNSLIVAYARRGRAHEALSVLSRMLDVGLRPTRFTFAPLLSVPSLGLGEGTQLHSLILKSGLLHAGPFSGTALLGLYARSGKLDGALALFEEMPVKTVATWNSIVAAFSQRGLVFDSMSLFRQLLASGIGVSECSVLSILPALCSSGSLHSMEQILCFSIKTAMVSFLVVANALLHSLSASSGVHVAERLFNSLPIRDAVSWNTMIAGFGKSGMPERALGLFLMMHANEILPSEATIASTLSACSSLNSSGFGELVHAKAIKHNLDNNVFVASSLINFYGARKRLGDAHKMFDEIPEKNTACWNALISGYSKSDSPTSIVLLKSMLQSDCRPNELSFSSALTGVPYPELQQLHSLIVRLGYNSNEYISTALITSYESHGIVSDASFAASSTGRVNSIASLYNRDHRYQEAEELLLQLQSPDTMSWNILLNASARNRDYSKALLFFSRMRSLGHLFDEYTAATLVSICSRINSLVLGRSIHGLIVKSISSCLDAFVCNMLLDMYAKCGSLDDCLRVFEEMGEKRNLISWTALISGLGLHGHPHEALARFDEMKSEGFLPDRVTLLAVLSACRHGGLVGVGMQLFESMKGEHGIEPEMDHYVCVIDMLCKCGHLKEAELLISGMPFQPNAVIWRTFLQGCKSFGDLLA